MTDVSAFDQVNEHDTFGIIDSTDDDLKTFAELYNLEENSDRDNKFVLDMAAISRKSSIEQRVFFSKMKKLAGKPNVRSTAIDNKFMPIFAKACDNVVYSSLVELHGKSSMEQRKTLKALHKIPNTYMHTHTQSQSQPDDGTRTTNSDNELIERIHVMEKQRYLYREFVNVICDIVSSLHSITENTEYSSYMDNVDHENNYHLMKQYYLEPLNENTDEHSNPIINSEYNFTRFTLDVVTGIMLFIIGYSLYTLSIHLDRLVI